jgi:hypothetical protein
MRIRFTGAAKQAASTMLVCLIICAILSFSVLGYLSVIEQQSLLGRRSQAWNVAISVAEAGVEEAMQHLNVNFANLAVDGWTLTGGKYTHTVDMGNGAQYDVSITMAAQPIIECRAYVKGLASLAQVQVVPVFAAVGVNADGSPVAGRAIRVYCKRGSLFTKAMAARHSIDLNGNNILTDSFDSESLTMSIMGRYDPSIAGDNGDIASNDTIVNSVSVGNANIYGHAATGPGGTIAIGLDGAVGSHSWQLSNTGTSQDGWVTHDSNFTFPDTSLPYSSGKDPSGGNVGEQQAVITSNLVTSSTAPGYSPWGGVQTNVVSTTISPTYPGNMLGLTTNTTTTTTSGYPATAPFGVQTNFLGTAQSSTYQDVAGITTNVSSASSGSLPNPIQPGTVTNTVYRKDKPLPLPGTYVGLIETNGVKFNYYEITGYTWPVYSYTYPVYSYTYKVIVSYNVPTYNYAYNLYTTNQIWVTNYYDHILESGNYYLSGTLSGKTIVLGQAQLVAAGGVSMSGNDVLKIVTGGSLSNYVGGTTLALAGNGVDNEAGLAKNFVCFAAPTVTSVSLSGNGTFTGVLVAPNGDVAMNGSGSTPFDFMGSLMVNSVRMNGTFRFHYDEALGRLGGNGRFLITKWEEIPVGP